jgi:hypothetical protein
MSAGEIAPALEARLGPVSIGPADVDRAELAQYQQHFIEVLGRGVIGVDQQGNIGFLFDRSVPHRDSFSKPLTAASWNDHSPTRPYGRT